MAGGMGRLWKVCLWWSGIGETSLIKGVKEVHKTGSCRRLEDLSIFQSSFSNMRPGEVEVFKEPFVDRLRATRKYRGYIHPGDTSQKA